MIKLKDIINEAFGRVNVWKTESGVPDEIINVIHELMAVVMKRIEPGEKTTDYISLTKGPFGWMIRNPKIPDLKMIYSPKNNTWWAPESIEKGTVNTQLSPNSLNLMIQNWTV
jgi:hypothetical protein